MPGPDNNTDLKSSNDNSIKNTLEQLNDTWFPISAAIEEYKRQQLTRAICFEENRFINDVDTCISLIETISKLIKKSSDFEAQEQLKSNLFKLVTNFNTYLKTPSEESWDNFLQSIRTLESDISSIINSPRYAQHERIRANLITAMWACRALAVLSCLAIGGAGVAAITGHLLTPLIPTFLIPTTLVVLEIIAETVWQLACHHSMLLLEGKAHHDASIVFEKQPTNSSDTLELNEDKQSKEQDKDQLQEQKGLLNKENEANPLNNSNAASNKYVIEDKIGFTMFSKIHSRMEEASAPMPTQQQSNGLGGGKGPNK